MEKEINTAVTAAMRSAAAALAVAVEAAADGVTPAELPAIEAHADKAMADIARVLETARGQAHRSSWNQEQETDGAPGAA